MHKASKWYAQNQEDKFICDFFEDYTGSLLDIGANDGKTLSNSLALIERGWSAVLVEPSPKAFERLQQLHKGNSRVQCENCAITSQIGEYGFYDTGDHLGKGDTSLLSTLELKELNRFGQVPYNKIKVAGITIKQLMQLTHTIHFDFITIDAEGQDVEILKQMDLEAMGCKLICVEWNSNKNTLDQIHDYMCGYNRYYRAFINAENVGYYLK